MEINYSNFENCIKKILNDITIENVVGNKLQVRERNNRAQGEAIEITSIKNSIVLGLDISDRKIYFLKNDSKINDQTILYFNNNTLKVLLLELKSRRKREYKKQILIGKAYIEFILAILDTENGFKIPNIEYRGFVFTINSRVKKQPTKRDKKFCPDEEVDGVFIKELKNNKTYNFNELIL